MNPLCLLALVAVIDCALEAQQYVAGVERLRARDWALVASVEIDHGNRGSSTGRHISLPANPYTTGPEWIVAHEVGHVRQRLDLNWWAAWVTAGFGPCTSYGDVHMAENQAEAFAAAYSGQGPAECATQAAWILAYDQREERTDGKRWCELQ